MKKDLVFICKKCRRHLLFISGTPSEKVKKIASLNNIECANCGEEGNENWIFVRTGNYEKEFGSKEGIV